MVKTNLIIKSMRQALDYVEHRAERAHNLIQMGELSAVRQALTATQLRCTRCVFPIFAGKPPELTGFQPTSLIELEQDRLLKNLTSARRAAGAPSGMTADHVRPLFQNEMLSLSVTCAKSSPGRKSFG